MARMSYVVINPNLVSQSSILAHPPHVRWAWLALVVEAQLKDGTIEGLTPFQLSKLASISIDEAKEALEVFLNPDEFSANRMLDGRRLDVVDEATSTYRLVTFDFHNGLITKARDAARKRIEYYAAKAENSGESTEKDGSSPETPPPTPSPTPTPKEEKEPRGRGRSASSAAEKVESFELTEERRRWAKERAPHIDVDKATEAWRDYCRGNGYKTGRNPIADPAAMWRRWITTDEEKAPKLQIKKHSDDLARSPDFSVSTRPIPKVGDHDERGWYWSAGRWMPYPENDPVAMKKYLLDRGLIHE